jgi:hypothetical protein
MLVVAAAMMVAPVGWTGSLGGVELDDELSVGGKTLELNGMGLRKKFVVKVYVAGLYLEEPSGDVATIVASDQIKRVVMHFRTNKATKKKMDAAWQEGFEKNSPAEYPALAERVRSFIALFGDMKVDDVIELTLTPGAGTEVVLNGEVKGTIDGDDFGAALLRVWLGDHPPSEDLKEGLLGQ